MDNSHTSLDSVASGFYKNPDADIAAEAVVAAIHSDLFQEQPCYIQTFTRMAEVYPEVRERFCQLIPTLGDEGQKRLRIFIDPPDEFKDANYLPTAVRSPLHLDMCWYEFLVTGSVEVVNRIIAVLDWEDLTRGLINESLADPNRGPLHLSEIQWQSFQERGLPIGLTKEIRYPHIAVPGDVDITVWFGVADDHEASKLVLQQLTEAQLLHMATKGAACWSLQSNAEQHLRIRQLCDREARVPGGAGRQYLAEPE